MKVSEILDIIADAEQKEMASKTAVEFVYKNKKHFPKDFSLGENSLIFSVTRSFYKKMPLTELKRRIKDLGTVAENASSAQLLVDGQTEPANIDSHYLSAETLELVVS